ncbi:MAG: Maf family protein [Candidatus Nanopelagicales bacterium]
MTASEWDVVLASASAARAGLLANAGLTARSIVSSVDEGPITAAWDPADAAGLVQTLADLKADDVVAQLGAVARPTIVLAADSMFRFDGELLGKPGDAQTATRRLAALSGRTGHLLTGHTVVVRQPDGRDSRAHEVAATEIWFAEFDDAELAAYVATGEPLDVAGGFTLDGIAAPLIQGISGDPSNVIGLSLPLIRRLLADLGVFWPDLWAQS